MGKWWGYNIKRKKRLTSSLFRHNGNKRYRSRFFPQENVWWSVPEMLPWSCFPKQRYQIYRILPGHSLFKCKWRIFTWIVCFFPGTFYIAHFLKSCWKVISYGKHLCLAKHDISWCMAEKSVQIWKTNAWQLQMGDWMLFSHSAGWELSWDVV